MLHDYPNDGGFNLRIEILVIESYKQRLVY